MYFIGPFTYVWLEPIGNKYHLSYQMFNVQSYKEEIIILFVTLCGKPFYLLRVLRLLRHLFIILKAYKIIFEFYLY